MKKIIVCPFSYHKNILKSLRDKDPFIDVKLIDKSEILSAYFGYFDNASIKYIMQNYHVNYELANIYLSYLPQLNKIINNSKVELLNTIKKDLIAHNYYFHDETFLNLIKNQEIEIIGYSKKDKILLNILKDLNVKYVFGKENIPFTNNVAIYQTLEDEVHALFIKICDLLTSNVAINDIYILGADSDYLNTVLRYAKLYGIPLNGVPSKDLKGYEFGKQFFIKYAKLKDIDEVFTYLDTEFINDEDYLAFKKVVIENYDSSLNFEMNYDILSNSLSIKKEQVVFDNAVRLISQPIYLNNKHIFVLGFRQNSYPIVKNDNGFLPDVILKDINMATSSDINLVNKDILLNFLSSNNNFYYSFSSKTNSGLAYLSFLVDNLALTPIKAGIPMHDFSKKASEIELVKMKDLKFKYRQIKKEQASYETKLNIKYRSYDNNFKSFPIFNKIQTLTHAYSPLKNYAACPFSYYLENLLKIETEDDAFNLDLGILCHAILQDGINDKSATFESLYQKNLDKSKFNQRQITLIEIIKDKIKNALEVARAQLKYIKDYQVFTEREVNAALDDNTLFHGFIDKMIITKNHITLIDYKSGSEGFDPKLIEIGQSLQLPTYCYLCSKDPDFSKYTVGGVFINNIINNKACSPLEDPLLPDTLKLKGRLISDVDYISEMEPEFIPNCEEGRYIYAKHKNKTNPFTSANFVSKEEMNSYKETVETYYKKMNEKIRANVFSVSPYSFNNKSACDHCKYQDICYRNNDQFRILKLTPAEEKNKPNLNKNKEDK